MRPKFEETILLSSSGALLLSTPPYRKQYFCPALGVFSSLSPFFSCLAELKTVRLPGKKLQNATKEAKSFILS